MMPRATTCVLSLLCVFSVVGHSHGQINYDMAERTLEASADGSCDGEFDQDCTVALGLYANSMSAAGDNDSPDDPDGAMAYLQHCQSGAGSHAEQSTFLGSAVIGGTAYAGAGGFGGESSAAATVNTSFHIDQAVPYSLIGELTGSFFDASIGIREPGDAIIRLSDESGIIHDIYQPTTAPHPFNLSGILPPGQYTLFASTTSGPVGEGGGEATFDFSFTVVPEPSSILTVMPATLIFLMSRYRTVKRCPKPATYTSPD